MFKICSKINCNYYFWSMDIQYYVKTKLSYLKTYNVLYSVDSIQMLKLWRVLSSFVWLVMFKIYTVQWRENNTKIPNPE